MNSVFFIPQRPVLHFTAKCITFSNGTGCAHMVRCPVSAKLCASRTANGVDGTWQTPRYPSLSDRCTASALRCKRMLSRTGWRTVATLLSTRLLPFHSVFRAGPGGPSAPLTGHWAQLQAPHRNLALGVHGPQPQPQPYPPPHPPPSTLPLTVKFKLFCLFFFSFL